ncbi:MAG: CBS domain-containing protein [Actinobacteria bacterium]|nr:CBS domain-containing protein [Actinomycetota bacterium]
MFGNYNLALAQTSIEQGNILLLLMGLAIFGGTVGARIFKQLKIPQVVGYIAIGILMGENALNLIKPAQVVLLQPFNQFALGIIGFLVGGEIRIDTLKKYARQFLAILFGEGLGAFILVTLFCSLAMYLVVHDVLMSVAVGLVLGAIASATDPASTIDVLWEYRARGVLTTSITAIVAMDDALAMTLYGLGKGAAEILTIQTGSIWHELGLVCVELLGAVALGFAIALLLRFLLRWLYEPEKSLAVGVGLIMTLIGIVLFFDMDVILASLALGFTLVNIAPNRSRELFKVLRGFSTPIYVLFFVLVGARLGLAHMPGWLWVVVVLYISGRTLGKMAGAWLGAASTGSEKNVRRYLGLGLFAQGGVAVGLSIVASQHLSTIQVLGDLSLGDTIIFTVTATTLLSQLIGPPMVKLSIKLADELGRNVTEEDIIASWKVADVMDKDIEPVPANMPMNNMVKLFATHDFLIYPVVNPQGQLAGTVSLAGIKTALSDKYSWAWLVASDVLEPITEKATQGAPLSAVLERMKGYRMDQMPVVDNEESDRAVGILDMTRILKKVDRELIRRRTPANSVQQ